MEPLPSTVAINGPKVRELRKYAGETIAILAARADISIQYLSQIERGERPNVGPYIFVKICNALGILPSERPSLVVPAAPQPVPPRPRRPRASSVSVVTQ